MYSMDAALSVNAEVYYDPEVDYWAYHVPSLRISGGGQPTRDEAVADCRRAIAFTLESLLDDSDPGERTTDVFDLTISAHVAA